MLQAGTNFDVPIIGLSQSYAYFLYIRNDFKYAALIRNYLKFNMSQLLTDMLLNVFNIIPSADEVLNNFDRALNFIIENTAFQLPFEHEENEVNVKSYVELLSDRVIIAVACELESNSFKDDKRNTYDAVTVNNDVIISMWWYLEHLKKKRGITSLHNRVINDISRIMCITHKPGIPQPLDQYSLNNCR